MNIENFTQYICAELLILIPVLYAIGYGLKKTEKIKDNYIPAILGGVGVLFALLYVHSFTATGIFTAITQGILCAAAAVYAHQLYKQGKNDDKKE